MNPLFGFTLNVKADFKSRSLVYFYEMIFYNGTLMKGMKDGW